MLESTRLEALRDTDTDLSPLRLKSYIAHKLHVSQEENCIVLARKGNRDVIVRLDHSDATPGPSTISFTDGRYSPSLISLIALSQYPPKDLYLSCSSATRPSISSPSAGTSCATSTAGFGSILSCPCSSTTTPPPTLDDGWDDAALEAGGIDCAVGLALAFTGAGGDALDKVYCRLVFILRGGAGGYLRGMNGRPLAVDEKSVDATVAAEVGGSKAGIHLVGHYFNGTVVERGLGGDGNDFAAVVDVFPSREGTRFGKHTIQCKGRTVTTNFQWSNDACRA